MYIEHGQNASVVEYRWTYNKLEDYLSALLHSNGADYVLLLFFYFFIFFYSSFVLRNYSIDSHQIFRNVMSRRKLRDGHTTNASLFNWLFPHALIQIRHNHVCWLSQRVPIPYRISGIQSSFLPYCDVGLLYAVHRGFWLNVHRLFYIRCGLLKITLGYFQLLSVRLGIILFDY